MATNTYTALRTTTVSTAVSSVTLDLTGITGYTDLVIVTSVNGSRASNLDTLAVRFNSDAGSNYSYTYLYGYNGSTASSGRATNQTNIWVGNFTSNSVSNNYSECRIQINNYANTTTYKTVLARGGSNASVGDVNANVGLWRGSTGSSTEAITSVTLRSETGSNFLSGSTFTVYGITAAPAWAAKATGGTITYDVNYTYHTFTSSGTFTPSVALTADYLVVAGGGGGGAELGAGGGGGGLRCTVGATGGGGTVETPLSLSATGYTVTIGAGGAGCPVYTGPQATNGSNSVFGSITSLGGGGAGTNAAGTDGLTGGSGGGGPANKSPGSGTTNQGYSGGTGSSTANAYGAGGGGGAGVVGQNGSGTSGGNGGNGVATSISGTSTYYAGGGGAGSYQYIAPTASGSGGLGGGGNAGAGYSGNQPGANGSSYTGGGGGGACRGDNNSSPGYWQPGGNGGSGIVIIRYAN